ncbi:TetR/AcrR family transcriptional regulator, partial [Nocardia farcinica]|uniref:TetR/AcrR family transcriptional regulator n=1 Tax=Nocardia farcinica TaxID=37329 RepID=UPI002456F585
MGRPRGFDEDEVIAAAARLFAERAYDGVSVDDLVNHLGVHRNSLYKVFGSKRGLYLAALRWYVEHRLRPAVGGGGGGARRGRPTRRRRQRGPGPRRRSRRRGGASAARRSGARPGWPRPRRGGCWRRGGGGLRAPPTTPPRPGA